MVFVQVHQSLDAAIHAAAIGVELVELADPLAAFDDRIDVADHQREQGLELAHAQLGPERVLARRQADQRRHRALVGELAVGEGVEQVGALVVIEVGEVQHGLAQGVADAVVLELELVDRVDLGHARHQHAAGVDAERGEFGHIHVVTFGMQRIEQPGMVFGGGGAEVPVVEGEVGFGAEEVPGDDSARVHKVDLQVLRAGDLVEIEARLGEAAQRIQRAALQELGERALERDFEARMGAEAGEAALVLRVEQGDVHHRIPAAQRGVLHPDAKAGGTQPGDTGGDVRIARDDVVRHVGQAQAFGDDAVLDVTLENLRQRLRLRLVRTVAGRHAVADVEVGDDVDGEIHRRSVALAHIGDGADAALDIARVEVDQLRGRDAAVGVVELLQFRSQQPGRPALLALPIFARHKPALLRVVHEAFAFGNVPPEVVVVPEVVAGRALEELAQRTCARRELGGALAVGEHQRAVALAQMNRPDALQRIQPGMLLDMKASGGEAALQGGDGGFERGVFAGDEVFGLHGVVLRGGAWVMARG